LAASCIAIEEAAGHADDVSGQHKVDNLALAIAQKLVASGKTVLDETQLGEFVAVEDEIAPFLDRYFSLDHSAQALQVGQRQIDKIPRSRHEGIVAPDVFDRARRAARDDRSDGNIHFHNLDQ
jgi:hypothetical protein